MNPRNRELWLALLAILLISLLYLGVVYRLGSIPAAQSFFGHSLGVIGFVMMLMTELLYSIRKRIRSARWGRMAQWLQFHIFTGLVGPYLVLLHSAWKFNGLAGMVLLLTAVIVASGFIGRYIYTAVPRTADGVELQAREIGQQIRLLEQEIQEWMEQQPAASQTLAQRLATQPPAAENGAMGVLGRFFSDLAYRWEWQRARRGADPQLRAQVRQVEQMMKTRRTLLRQMESLASARKLLATWHAVHIPIGMALFTAAFVHIAAAIYYATLLH